MGALAEFLGVSVAKLVIYGVVALTLSGGVTWFYFHIEDIGWRKALTKVETNDKGKADEAVRAASTVHDCFNRGGVWIVQTGKCEPQGR